MGWKKILDNLIESPIDDSFRARQARYFNMVLLCFMVILIVGSVILIVNDHVHPYERPYLIFNGLFGLSAVIISFLLSKMGFFRPAVYLFVGMVIISITMATINRGLSFSITMVYALCIVMAGLLVGTRTAFCVAFWSTVSYAFAFWTLYEDGRIDRSVAMEIALFNLIAFVSSAVVLAFFTGVVYKGLVTQLEDMRRSRKKLKEQEARFKALFETSKDALMTLDRNGFLDCNRQTLSLFGLSSKKEFVNMSPWKLSPPMQPNGETSESLAKKRIAYAFEHGHNKFEWVHRTKCGDDFPAEVWLTSLEVDGKAILQATVRDITERKMRERRLRDNVEEKDVLLREIHHRVKNNLQTVSSLLNLQSKHIEDEEAVQVLTDTLNRIRSIALIHEKLYTVNDIAKIDFKEYVESLLKHLVHAHMIDVERIGINIDVDNVNLGVDKAITCGLILNELVTNSFKHAFPGEADGNVSIVLKKDGENVNITVSDDGIGMNEMEDLRNTNTLGLQLVMTLARDLDANIDLVDGKGTTLEITFPE